MRAYDFNAVKVFKIRFRHQHNKLLVNAGWTILSLLFPIIWKERKNEHRTEKRKLEKFVMAINRTHKLTGDR